MRGGMTAEQLRQPSERLSFYFYEALAEVLTGYYCIAWTQMLSHLCWRNFTSQL